MIQGVEREIGKSREIHDGEETKGGCIKQREKEGDTEKALCRERERGEEDECDDVSEEAEANNINNRSQETRRGTVGVLNQNAAYCVRVSCDCRAQTKAKHT